MSPGQNNPNMFSGVISHLSQVETVFMIYLLLLFNHIGFFIGC